MKSILFKSSIFFSLLLILSCNYLNKNKNAATKQEPYFEGEIKVSESQGLYGELFKVHTTYVISENVFKRHQVLGGLNSTLNIYAGIIIDLKKDSVVLYYVNSGTKNKHTLSVKDYKAYIQANEITYVSPSPYDATFMFLGSHRLLKQVKDSMKIQEFTCDYTMFHDSLDILKQEVFDTKDIKVKREILEMVFIQIPEEVNFPLKSEIRTSISDISNDSILGGEQTKSLEALAREIMGGNSQTTTENKFSLEKLSQNKLVKLGLNILKKGVDLNIHINTELSEIIKRQVTETELALPSESFTEIKDFNKFMEAFPRNNDMDFDD